MNRRDFLSNTAIGASALAFPVAGIPKAPIEFEYTCVVAMLLSIRLNGLQNCTTWPRGAGQLVPTKSITVDIDRRELDIPGTHIHYVGYHVATFIFNRMRDRKQHTLFLMQPDYLYTNTWDNTTVQTRLRGGRMDFTIHYRTSDNHFRPMPFDKRQS